MPKLRNASTDVGKMTQYLARKCVIHSPQAELDLDLEALSKSPRFGKKAPHFKGSKVHMLGRADGEEPNQFVAISPRGRLIRVTVEEVSSREIDSDTFAKVGT